MSRIKCPGVSPWVCTSSTASTVGSGLITMPGSAPEGSIVDTLVFVSTPVSYVVQFDLHQAAFDGAASVSFASCNRRTFPETGSAHRIALSLWVHHSAGAALRLAAASGRVPRPRAAASSVALRRPAGAGSSPFFLGLEARGTWIGHDLGRGNLVERFLLLREVRAVLAVLLDQHGDLLGRLGTDAQPIGDALAVEDCPGIGIGNTRIVGAQFFQGPAVARGILIERTHAEKSAMGPTHLLHANSDCHVVLLAWSTAT